MTVPIVFSVVDSFGILGDINQDEEINISDIVLLVNIVINNEYNAAGDINSDGINNVIDIVLLVNIILQN